MGMIAKGAEAELFLEEGKLIKNRIEKRYRISQIDESLRRTRTRIEAKILQNLPEGVLAPALLKSDEKNHQIIMSYIKGKKVRDILDTNLHICKEIGEKIALLHNAGIIHGDLTTSNMIYDKEVYLIDFGLSYFSEKIEDKAVDLHLLRQALESKHYKVFEKAFAAVLEGYKSKSKSAKEIIARLEKVESRGRNKNKT